MKNSRTMCFLKRNFRMSLLTMYSRKKRRRRNCSQTNYSRRNCVPVVDEFPDEPLFPELSDAVL